MRDQILQLLGLMSPSRFPRTTDKIINLFITGAALLFALIWSIAKDRDLANEFTEIYQYMMPKDMLIHYRGCLFVARKGHMDIWLLNPESEAYVFEKFDPKKGDVVVDMGAHVGKYTLPSAKSVGEKGHVFAFEAVPTHFETLENNIELNEFSNVTALNAATYDMNQDMWLVGWDLQSKPDPDHPEVDHINPEGSLQVEAVTVDSVLEEHEISSVDYVKIDIGRQEFNAIRGMESTLRASDEVTMVVEIGEENFEDVDALLSDMGFRGATRDDSWGARGLKDYVYEKSAI